MALALPRSVESVSSVWAVAKAGAAFVPVDPSYPADRIAFMLEDCGAPIGVTTAALRDGLPEGTHWIVLDDDEFRAAVASYPADAVTDADRSAGALSVDHPAYVIYTSGSTGRPKGVAVTHRGVVNLAADERDRFGVSVRVAGVAFRVAEFRCVGVRVGDGGVCGGDAGGGADHDFRWLGVGGVLVAEHGVSHAFCTPAALASLDHRGLDRLKTVVVAGDVCPPELVARWAPGRMMVNAYGPSETTIMSSATGPLVPGRPVTYRVADGGCGSGGAGSAVASGSGRGAGGAVCLGFQFGARVCASGGVDGGAVRGVSVRCGWADVSHG